MSRLLFNLAVASGSRGVAPRGRPSPPLFWVNNKEITEGRIAAGQPKQPLPLPLYLKVWIRHCCDNLAAEFLRLERVEY